MITLSKHSKLIALCSGAALIALGIAIGTVVIYGQVRARESLLDADAMAEELRANGAIVGNYYKVLGSSYNPPPPPVPFGSYVAAGVLVVGGGILVVKAFSFPGISSQTIGLKKQNKPDMATPRKSPD